MIFLLLAIAALLQYPRLRSAVADCLLGLLASPLLISALGVPGVLLSLLLAGYLLYRPVPKRRP